MNIVNGIIEGDLTMNKDGLNILIENLPNIKQINGNLYLVKLGLTELPDMSNIVINGNFTCNNNKLTSLVGLPRVIKGYLDCYKNNITSVEYFPYEIGIDISFDKQVNLFKFSKEEILRVYSKLTDDILFLNKSNRIS